MSDDDGRGGRRAREALRRLGLWDGCSPLALGLASDATHSNVTIEARCEAGHFALRLLNGDDGGFVDRAGGREAEAQAWRLGLGAEPMGFDEAAGVAASRWIEDAAPLTAGLLRDDPALLARVAGLLRRLHRSGATFRNIFDGRAVVASYRARLAADELAARWTPATGRAVDAALDAMTGAPAPCHGDATPANILLAPGGLRLIDWEYAAMADPAWDLGYLACEASLGDDDVARLVAGYADASMTQARIRAAMLAAAAISTLWTLLRLRAAPSPAMEAAFLVRRATLLSLTAR